MVGLFLPARRFSQNAGQKSRTVKEPPLRNVFIITMNPAQLAIASGGSPAKKPLPEPGMAWIRPRAPDLRESSAFSCFHGAGGVAEWHFMIGREGAGPDTAMALEARWLAALSEAGVDPNTTIMRRVFCSDVVNQAPALDHFARAYPGAFSVIGQTPAQGGKFAIWSHHLVDRRTPPAGEGSGSCFTLDRGPLRHLWLSGLSDAAGENAESQCRTVLTRHDEALAAHGMTLGDDVIRTWWFVRNIDGDYQALVDARRDAFDRHNLTSETHYIASTGIAGCPAEPLARLSLDSYAISGLLPGQVEYLSAPAHLGPTHMYGVTFERATAVSYADRKHVFVSGTASIDPSGAIVHPGNVQRQLVRTMENVSALLATAGGGIDDLAMAIVYLRDPADFMIVEQRLRHMHPGLPMIMVHAPVCRAGWLVEIEAIAIIPHRNPTVPDF